MFGTPIVGQVWNTGAPDEQYAFGEYVHAGRFPGAAMNPRGQSWDPGMYAGYGQAPAVWAGAGVAMTALNAGVGWWLWRVAKRQPKGAGRMVLQGVSILQWIQAVQAAGVFGGRTVLEWLRRPEAMPAPMPAGGSTVDPYNLWGPGGALVQG